MSEYQFRPSDDQLREMFPFNWRTIVAVMEGDIDPMSFKEVRQQFAENRCVDDFREQRMAALNHLVNGFGVKTLFEDGSTEPAATYVDFGETYKRTIIWDHEEGCFFLCSWGDWLEDAETRGMQFS